MSGMSIRAVRFVAVLIMAVMVAACSSSKGGSGASTTDTMGGGSAGTDVGDGSVTSVGVGSDGGLTPEEMAALEAL